MFGEYILNQAYWAAETAKIAYLRHRDMPSGINWDGRIHFRSGNTAGVILWGDTVCLLGIAGTDDLVDWVHNMDLSTHRYGQLGFSRGMYIHASELARYMIQELMYHRINPFENRRLFIGAHSLGAGAAVAFPFAFEDMLKRVKRRHVRLSAYSTQTLHSFELNPLSPEHIFCFDGPRVLATSSGGKYPFMVTHVRTENDIVSDVPPRIPYFIDRSHFGRVLWICGDDVRSSPGFTRRTTRLLRLIASGWPLRWKTLLAAHSIDLVLHALSRYAYSPDWRGVICENEPTVPITEEKSDVGTSTRENVDGPGPPVERPGPGQD